MNVSEAIRTKRAVREFLAEPLPDESVRAILYAGRRAQSAKNTQPWHFIAIRNRDTLKTLSGMGTWAGHLAGAALGVVILTPDPAQRYSIMFDAGQSASYMQLAAWELGIGSCLATIYEPEKARELLDPRRPCMQCCPILRLSARNRAPDPAAPAWWQEAVHGNGTLGAMVKKRRTDENLLLRPLHPSLAGGPSLSDAEIQPAAAAGSGGRAGHSP
jgi:hypothetical protein